MQLKWNNGFFVIGREYLERPNYTHSMFLAWNRRDLLTGEATPINEFSHADHIQILWRWPRLRGVTFRRFKMDWRDCQP